MNFKNFKIYIGFKDLNKRVNYVKEKIKIIITAFFPIKYYICYVFSSKFILNMSLLSKLFFELIH